MLKIKVISGDILSLSFVFPFQKHCLRLWAPFSLTPVLSATWASKCNMEWKSWVGDLSAKTDPQPQWSRWLKKVMVPWDKWALQFSFACLASFITLNSVYKTQLSKHNGLLHRPSHAYKYRTCNISRFHIYHCVCINTPSERTIGIFHVSTEKQKGIHFLQERFRYASHTDAHVFIYSLTSNKPQLKAEIICERHVYRSFMARSWAGLRWD